MKHTKRFLLFCLLALGAALAVAAQNAPTDDLQSLSDEFNDEKSLAGWKQFHEAEGWMSMTKTLDVNKTSAGNLYFEPTTSGWYADFHGAFLYKEVAGDFLATARLKVSGKTGELPTALWSLAGLMVREPRPKTNKENWQPAGENWLFFTTGIAEPAGQAVFETKSTVNSRSNLKLRPARAGWVELAVARARSAFILLYRRDGETKWTVQERFHRRDLPRSVQVGVNAYSDWYGAQEFHDDPYKFNTVPAKNGKADLVLTVDYFRFRRLQATIAPRSDGGELTDYAVGDEELLKRLGL
ncbi:MAG TPA: hypothetical protein VIL74_03930 [Pyrinomonadaceae bacterium]|jgi:regulation of enolase protein 1 (concanavalin A-like superfamily)